MTKLTGAALDKAVANVMGIKSVHNCEKWGEERNFCPRCGKRLGGEDSIHTCTPPQRTEQELPCYSFKAYWETDGRIGVVACIERPDGGVHLMSEILDLPPSTEPQHTPEHQARIAAFKDAMLIAKEKNT